ncbi:ligase-associated DNA damage response DEXH box helicase [Herbaspirillum sp. LeCh32-8]|uniref:ligase-associated DNA damage response DEXH box helicase n=1 Tax=Herbaspirillum sp. LeCh32-8 TaxID=2821356 RepID=UPI001AE29EB4|nr:ligase-associated DNA damage response DEXH box helicase [Herbaspirillum sp. LeCh32-8]MBP0597235.1 ligase-associated DNA damage response DEXH box helicase [Herbaspirillum sp. LeCh32-8]
MARNAATRIAEDGAGLAAVEHWFQTRGWSVFDFQRELWQAAASGRSGLLHAGTGSGKTYAVWFGALLHAEPMLGTSSAPTSATGLRVLWITPMRALAADTLRALQAPLAELLPHWQAGMRTGDTGSAERARQMKSLPQALVTTPESLSLLLSQADARQRFGKLDAIIVDEWHELMGNKRGVQVQLALARLRRWRPQLAVWGLSATLGNLEQAMQALLGPRDAPQGVLVRGEQRKRIVLDTLLPPHPSRFAWAGHLGMQMLPAVVAEIEASASTLVFTNTRSQAELWYQHLLEARPDWAGLIALHHGSLDREVRDWVEQGLRTGKLKAVVCTSSLDLGVDFTPVERVLQIGSPRGVARLLQRAGRSGHSPGRVSRATLVPTNSLELVESAAAQHAVAAGQVEQRPVPEHPLDVLVQHLVTIALGGGFRADELLAEVRSAWSYRNLSDAQWQWALDFVVRGGQSLTAYPEYHRVRADADGVYRVELAAIARRHRMNVGTIVSDASMHVQYLRGGRIGTIEEGFIARLKPGDRFLFGGRMLEFVRVHEMTAWVRRAGSGSGAVPRWQGGRMPLSSTLAHAVLDRLEEAAHDKFIGPEMQAVRPLLELQRDWSSLPTAQRLVVEAIRSREGHHLFFYPFAGRLVHVGLASLLAWRLARGQPATFSIAVNDYGFELLGAQQADLSLLAPEQAQALFSEENLLADVLSSLNATELSQRRFREIARIAGLVSQGYPGQPKSARQLQASSALFFEVFRKHDAGNLLLDQAQAEVLEQELELQRLRATLAELRARTLTLQRPARPTPFALPLMVERFREKLSTEKLADRVARMLRELERAADKPSAKGKP